jgi:putative sigma-54 modulation protein
MRLELTGRHVDITPGLRRLVTSKLSKLERMLNDRAVSAQAVLSREKHTVRADITLHARGEKFLHGVGNGDAWESSIGQAIDKISQQAQRVKSKYTDRKHRAASKGTPIIGEVREAASVSPAGPAKPPRERVRMPRILRATRQTIKAMSVADAARMIDGDPDGIVIFYDTERDSVSVLYRRDGELTLVETEA